MSIEPDPSGQQYGKLMIVSSKLVRVKPGRRVYLCQCECECGGKKTARLYNLKTGAVALHCGCENTYEKRRKLPKSDDASRHAIMHRYRYRAKKRGHIFELTDDQMTAIFSSPCVYCGTIGSCSYARTGRIEPAPAFVYNGLDRIDNELGYTVANVVPCCEVCNRAKRHYDLDFFLAWLKRIAKNAKARNSWRLSLIEPMLVNAEPDAEVAK